MRRPPARSLFVIEDLLDGYTIAHVLDCHRARVVYARAITFLLLDVQRTVDDVCSVHSVMCLHVFTPFPYQIRALSQGVKQGCKGKI